MLKDDLTVFFLDDHLHFLENHLTAGLNVQRPAPSRPDLGERWPSRLVATAAEDRLNISLSSRQSFRRTLADGIFLTPLTLLAVPTFEFFSDVLHGRAHGHGWVTE
jgi:hypothetical protein